MNLNKLLIAQFLSNIGNYAIEILFVLTTIELSNNNFFLVGIVYFLKFIPYLIFGPIGGWLSDIKNKKNIMITADLLRFIVMTIFFILYYYRLINLLILALIMIIHTIGRSFFQPCFQAVIPEIIDNRDIIKANSYNQIAIEIATICGPLIASALIAINSKPDLIIFDALTFIFSALIIITINYNPIANNSHGNKSNILKELKDNIFKLYKNNKSLLYVITFSALSITCIGALLRFLLPALILFRLGDESYIGIIISFIAIGTIIGGIYSSKSKISFSAKTVLLSWIIYGIIFSCFAFIHTTTSFILISTILGISGAFVDIGIVVNIQKESAPSDRGKVFGLFSTLANTGESASGLIGGVVALLGLPISVLLMGVMTCIFPLIGIIKMVKNNSK